MSYKANMQRLWKQYEAEHGMEPSTIADCFEWAIKNKLWAPKPVDVGRIFNREMANALREESRTDASGRKYRARHCVRRKIGDQQLSLWGDIDVTTREFFEESVQQRRKGLVDDGYQLKADVDHFNEYRSPDNPIQLVLDITDDVAEREALGRPDDDADEEDAA